MQDLLPHQYLVSRNQEIQEYLLYYYKRILDKITTKKSKNHHRRVREVFKKENKATNQRKGQIRGQMLI